MDDLERFIMPQEINYKFALREMKAGRKQSHWIWFIFPQLRGLGPSRKSEIYGIKDIDEAKNYLAHPVLGKRLIEITETILSLSTNDPFDLMASEIDAIKLKSSMTLFALASGEEDSIFHKVLEKFFGGEMDGETINLIKKLKQH